MSLLDNAPNFAEGMEWGRHMKAAEDFMPQARDAWTRYTDKPWNKHAMQRVLAEFSARLTTTPESN